jgi:ATP-dependent DNA helicase RecQ
MVPALMGTEEVLRDVFGLPGFRPGQAQVVDSVLSGRHTVAVMPTGAGKSLCYQFPAVVSGGTALIVSPLIALMKDQVDSMTARGVPAAAISSALSPSEVNQALFDMAEGRLRLVYVAPERFRSPRFLSALARIRDRLSLFAVDEAHCISQWGHDFRPDYLRLGEAIAELRPPRLLAVTATATPEVRRDLASRLGMKDPLFLVRGFDRPNLHFAVERVSGSKDKLARLRERVRARGGGVALVYAATRKNAEAYAQELQSAGMSVAVYHAGLESNSRAAVQDRFMSGKLDAIVATNAFGMGVDKANVRLVVHGDLPRSPEAYYQEAGRAGRDGHKAECVVLFSPSDVRLQEFLIDASCPSVEVLRGLWKLLRDDPRRGGSLDGLGKRLPGTPSDGAVGAAARFLERAGYLRCDEDNVYTALRPGEDPDAPPVAPLDTEALSHRAEVERDKLRAMVDYAYAAGCRRRFLLAWFGDEDAATATCSGCDNCLGVGKREVNADEDRAVRSALAIVERLRGRFGRTRVAALLAGNDDDERFSDLPERGALRVGGARYALDVLRALEGAGYVMPSPGEYPTLALTKEGKSALHQKERLSLVLPEAKTKKVRARRRA